MVDLVINAFCWRHEYMAFELPRHFVSDEQLFDQVLTIMKQHGRLANGLSEAMHDGQIDAQEYDLIERDIRTCISGLLRLKKKLHVKHMESE